MTLDIKIAHAPKSDMKMHRLIQFCAMALCAIALTSCSKNLAQGRYIATDQNSDYVEILPDNKIQMIHGGFLFATMDYKISGDKVAVGGGGRFGDQYQIQGNTLVELGTRRQFVHR